MLFEAKSNIKMKTIQDFLLDFLEYLEINKNRSQKTIENYDHYLTQFFNWSKVKKISEINEKKILSYRVFLSRTIKKNGQPLSINTQNHNIIIIRSFLKFIQKKGIETLSPEKIELAKTPQRQVDFLEKEELGRLLNACSGESLQKLRDRAILEVLFSSGLRVSELTSLDIEKINLSRQEFSIRGKGGKLRIIFISDRAKKYLEKYLSKRKDLDPALFVRIIKNPTIIEDSLRLTTRSIQRIIKKYTLKAGILKEVTPHTLRHTFATDLLENGADIRFVQALLGHSSINTTQIYTHVTNKNLRLIHQKFHNKN